MRAAQSASKGMVCDAGEYRVWHGTSGAEVWLHYPRRDPAEKRGAGKPFDAIGELKGLTVRQRGASDITMRLVTSVGVSADNPLDGACIASLAPLRGGGRPVPFVFEHVGFATEPVEHPIMARVQVTGLAHKITAYPSEKAYLAATPGRRLLGRGSVIAVEPDEIRDVNLIYRSPPGALWLVTGTVRRTICLKNPDSGSPYVWVLLETDRGDIDVVANPSVIVGDVSIGHTLQAVVSMSGRILQRLGPG